MNQKSNKLVVAGDKMMSTGKMMMKAGCLTLLALLGLAIIANIISPTKTEKSSRQAESPKSTQANKIETIKVNVNQDEIASQYLAQYKALLKTAEITMISKLAVRVIESDIWELKLTVKNIWHVRVKQIRLQDAQILWQAWANIASPQKPDKARIKIVDLNGNEVGGSRVWAGSLIWVQD